ncbi:hypothetical protein OE88DRAFT_907986 [Heliocybe sulcata]|uniref:Fungal-type protein kinase domain-containing protein n=1 Tax=Heliocybe sulcata TaxID=5364 RepID=A0A5C3MMD2_9AGAM|nr:hypothetical protein OE88DRAFT_907986 [Heliocybe sulcata]
MNMPWNTRPAERKRAANGTQHMAGSDAYVPVKRPKTNPGSKTNFCTAEADMDVDSSDHGPNLQPINSSPNAQVVSYASQRLSSSPAIKHSFQFVIHVSDVSLWWLDRCSAIVSGSIYLVTDLPHLVLLLVMSQRGVNRLFGNRALLRWPGVDLTQPGIPSLLRATLDETEHTLDILPSSHGTDAGPATCPDEHPIAPGMSLGVVANIPRTEEHHNDDVQAFAREYQVARGDDDDTKCLPGHSPVLRTSEDHNDEGAEQMAKVSRPRKEHRCRLLHVLSFTKMDYIHKLSNEEFMSAFYDCFRCHGRAWLIGIHHRDICPNNLLFTRVRGYAIGILYDSEMSLVRRHASSPEYERTGTIGGSEGAES